MATPAQRPWIRRIGATGLVLTSLAFPASVTTAVTAQAATAGDSRQQATLAVLRGKAEAGDSGAMLALGQHYLGGLPLDGKPLKADPAEALRWLRQAANHNNAEAACTLASIYRSRNHGAQLDAARGQGRRTSLHVRLRHAHVVRRRF